MEEGEEGLGGRRADLITWKKSECEWLSDDTREGVTLL